MESSSVGVLEGSRDARPEKGLRSFLDHRVDVGAGEAVVFGGGEHVDGGREPDGVVEAESGVNCEHQKVLVTICCRSIENGKKTGRELGSSRKERSIVFRSQPAWMLDVRMACDVAKPSVVVKIMTHMGVDGHVVAALLKEMRDTREVCVLRKLRGQLQVLKMYQTRED